MKPFIWVLKTIIEGGEKAELEPEYKLISMTNSELKFIN
jgi:hypothetical protein